MSNQGGVLKAFLVLLAILLIVLGYQYTRDLRASRRRLSSYDTHKVETSSGMISYVDTGNGQPVLALHGAAGGYDQGILNSQDLISENYRIISPSRFGYPGSSLPESASPSEQADALADLLDSLDVQTASVIAWSAGSTSALQLAIRNPDRVNALILVAPNAPSPEEPGAPPRALLRALTATNFPFWFMIKYTPSAIHSLIGVPEGYNITEEDQVTINEVKDTLLPITRRRQGLIFDLYISNPDINESYSLEDITASTLIINAKDDPLADYQNSIDMAEEIPVSETLILENGGHLLLGQTDLVSEMVSNFLSEQNH